MYDSLNHFESMTTLPKAKREWLSLLALPFKAFVFAYGFIYPIWLFSAPGTPGTIGGPDTSVLETLAVGYFLTSLALFGIAVAQVLFKDRRGAVWNSVFAVLALGLALVGVFYPGYR
jgi:hypothetical protein